MSDGWRISMRPGPPAPPPRFPTAGGSPMGPRTRRTKRCAATSGRAPRRDRLPPPHRGSGMSRGRVVALVAIATLVAVFFVFDLKSYISADYFRAQQAAIDAYFRAHPLLTAAIYFAIYVAVTGLSLPGAAIMTLVGGAVFGLLWGTVIVSFAYAIGATLAFLAVLYLLLTAIQARFGNKLAAINRGVEKEGAFYLFALRLVPAFPFVVINLVMGLTPMKTRTFYWVSQLGMLAGTIVYVYAGTKLGEFQVSKELVAALVLVGVFPLIAKKVLDALRARKVYAKWRKPARFDPTSSSSARVPRGSCRPTSAPR